MFPTNGGRCTTVAADGLRGQPGVGQRLYNLRRPTGFASAARWLPLLGERITLLEPVGTETVSLGGFPSSVSLI